MAIKIRGTTQIMSGSISDAELASNSVTSEKLCEGSVTEPKIGEGAVTSTKIGVGAIRDIHINAAAAISLSKLERPVIRADGVQAFLADQSMGNHKLTNVRDPDAPGDVATKNYVDSHIPVIAGPFEVGSGGPTTARHRDVHNDATADCSAALSGESNTANGVGSVVVGGSGNITNGSRSFVGAGELNVTNGINSVVVGGSKNSSGGDQAAVLGGFFNSASAGQSGVVSGYQNQALGIQSFVGSGTLNTVSGQRSFIGAGISNFITVSGSESAILGGRGNSISGNLSTVLGGSSVSVSGNYSLAAGRNALVYSDNTFSWGVHAAPTTIDLPDSFIIGTGNLGVGIPTSFMSAEHVIGFQETTTPPTGGTPNTLFLYARDDAGTACLFAMDDAGTEYKLAGSGIGSWWQRVGTVLSPLTANDNVEVVINSTGGLAGFRASVTSSDDDSAGGYFVSAGAAGNSVGVRCEGLNGGECYGVLATADTGSTFSKGVVAYGVRSATVCGGEFHAEVASDLAYGVWAEGRCDGGLPGSIAYGVWARGDGAETNYGVYATSSGGTTNWAGWFDGNVKIDGKLTVTGLIDPMGLVLDEVASCPWTPESGKGALWVRSDSPTTLWFTDSDGIDYDLTNIGGYWQRIGTDLSPVHANDSVSLERVMGGAVTTLSVTAESTDGSDDAVGASVVSRVLTGDSTAIGTSIDSYASMSSMGLRINATSENAQATCIDCVASGASVTGILVESLPEGEGQHIGIFSDVGAPYGVDAELRGVNGSVSGYGTAIGKTHEYIGGFFNCFMGIGPEQNHGVVSIRGVKTEAIDTSGTCSSVYGVYSLAQVGSPDCVTYSGYFETIGPIGPAGLDNYGVYADCHASGTTNYGIYATASEATTNWAGWFDGNVCLSGNLYFPNGPAPAYRSIEVQRASVGQSGTDLHIRAAEGGPPVGGSTSGGILYLDGGLGGGILWGGGNVALNALTPRPVLVRQSETSASIDFSLQVAGGIYGEASSMNVAYGLRVTAGGVGSYGVHATAEGAALNNYGVYGEASGVTAGTNYGVYGTASGAAANWAGWFDGNVGIGGNLDLGGVVTGSLTVGAAKPGEEYSLTFHDEGGDGILTWDGDDGKFRLSHSIDLECDVDGAAGMMVENVNTGTNSVAMMALENDAGHVAAFGNTGANLGAAGIADCLFISNSAGSNGIVFNTEGGEDIRFGSGAPAAFVESVAIRSGNLVAANNVTIGSRGAGVDYVLTFDGESNTGTITYMEDEDRFDLNNDVKASGTVEAVGGFRDGTFAWAESTAESSFTGSTAYQRKLRLTTGTVPAGTYRIGWYFERSADDENTPTKFRVRIDDTTTCMTVQPVQKKRWADGAYNSESGFCFVALTNAAHDIDLDYGVTDPGITVYVRNAHLEIHRVS